PRGATRADGFGPFGAVGGGVPRGVWESETPRGGPAPGRYALAVVDGGDERPRAARRAGRPRRRVRAWLAGRSTSTAGARCTGNDPRPRGRDRRQRHRLAPRPDRAGPRIGSGAKPAAGSEETALDRSPGRASALPKIGKVNPRQPGAIPGI